MKITKPGLDLIKHYEGLRLTTYHCPAGVPTIGYGSTNKKYAYPGNKITETEAHRILLEDIVKFEMGVNSLLKGQVVKQPRFDSLVSFSFNVGLDALSSSTLLKKYIAGDVVGASNEFSRWNKGGGRVLEGLNKRRKSERHLFLTGEFLSF